MVLRNMLRESFSWNVCVGRFVRPSYNYFMGWQVEFYYSVNPVFLMNDTDNSLKFYLNLMHTITTLFCQVVVKMETLNGFQIFGLPEVHNKLKLELHTESTKLMLGSLKSFTNKIFYTNRLIFNRKLRVSYSCSIMCGTMMNCGMFAG